MKRLSIKLSEELHAALREAAEREQRSMASLVRHLLTKAVQDEH